MPRAPHATWMHTCTPLLLSLLPWASLLPPPPLPVFVRVLVLCVYLCLCLGLCHCHCCPTPLPRLLDSSFYVSLPLCLLLSPLILLLFVSCACISGACISGLIIDTAERMVWYGMVWYGMVWRVRQGVWKKLKKIPSCCVRFTQLDQLDLRTRRLPSDRVRGY